MGIVQGEWAKKQKDKGERLLPSALGVSLQEARELAGTQKAKSWSAVMKHAWRHATKIASSSPTWAFMGA